MSDIDTAVVVDSLKVLDPECRLEKHGLTAIKLQLSGAPTAVPESIRAVLNEK